MYFEFISPIYSCQVTNYFLDALDLCCPIKAPQEVLLHLYWLFSALHGQEKAVWKSRPGILSNWMCFDSARDYLWYGAIKCISFVVLMYSVFPNLVTNFFDSNDPGHKAVTQRKCFVAWIITIKVFNVINSIPMQTLAAPFSFHNFSAHAFLSLGHNFFKAREPLLAFLVKIIVVKYWISEYTYASS